MLIYNIPYRTAVNLSNDSLLELAEVPNIVGVKDSCGILAQSLDLLARKPAGFSVLTGEDALYFTMLANGADGGILAASHLMTERFLEVGRRFAANDVAGARAAWAPLASLVPLLFAEANPMPIKHLLWRQGLIASPECRLPLTRITDALARRLDAPLCARLQEIADLRQQLLLFRRRLGRRRAHPASLANSVFMALTTRNSTKATMRKFTATVMNWP